MTPQTDLEQRILETAKQLFLEHGFAQTSTTDIARAVGCNQALVHYYYRTKERLFRKIFEQEMNNLLDFANKFTYSDDLWSFLSTLVDYYFSFLTQNPKLPFFILNELVLNEERRAWMRETFIQNERRQKAYYAFSDMVMREIKKGTIRQIEPLDLLLDIVSLVVMTFICMPIYSDLLQKTPEELNDFLAHRKQEVLLMLEGGLTPPANLE
mgnify:CR=1 FL=1